MMNKKMKVGLLFMACVSAIAIIAFVTGDRVKVPTEVEGGGELIVNEDLIVENPILIVEEIRNALSQGDLQTGESILDTNITRVSIAEADEMVYYYIQSAETYGNMLMGSNPEFMSYLRENRVKEGDIEKFVKKSDTPGFIKEIWDDMRHEMIKLEVGAVEEYIHESYLTRFVPDYLAILDKYSEYISEQMKDLIMMRSEVKWNYSKTYEGGFVPEIVERNIEALKGYLDKYQGESYTRAAKEDYEFLIQVYFGYLPGGQIFNPYDFTATTDKLEMYEKAAKRDGFLGEKAGIMAEALKASNMTLTPELFEIIEELAEVDEYNFFPHWNNALGIDIPYEGEGRGGASEVLEEVITDPETGEILDIIRHP